MVLRKHPYTKDDVRLVRVHQIPGERITMEEYVTYPSDHLRFFRIVSDRKLTQKIPPKGSRHETWWVNNSTGQLVADTDLFSSTPISRQEYDYRDTKGLRGYLASTEALSSILDRYSRLPDRDSYDATDFFITKTTGRK